MRNYVYYLQLKVQNVFIQKYFWIIEEQQFDYMLDWHELRFFKVVVIQLLAYYHYQKCLAFIETYYVIDITSWLIDYSFVFLYFKLLSATIGFNNTVCLERKRQGKCGVIIIININSLPEGMFMVSEHHKSMILFPTLVYYSYFLYIPLITFFTLLCIFLYKRLLHISWSWSSNFSFLFF